MGTGIICHGKSSPHAIKNAILEALEMEKLNINELISRDLEGGISNMAEVV